MHCGARTDTSSVEYAVKDRVAIGGEVRDLCLAWCDLRPDGTISPNPTIGLRVWPSSLFPALPKDEAASKTGWAIPGDEIGSTIAAVSVPTDKAALFRFKTVSSGPVNKVYDIVQEATYTLDIERGVITRTELPCSQALSAARRLRLRVAQACMRSGRESRRSN